MEPPESKEKKQIAFVGTKEYRHHLKTRALEFRTTVQQMIEDALQHYFAMKDGDLVPVAESQDPVRNLTLASSGGATQHDSFGTISSISAKEIQWVRGLLRVIRGKNELARNAILTNILAFTDYESSVPEVIGDSADIAALEARLAAIQQRLVDREKKADVGGNPNKQTPGRRPPKKAGGE